MAKIFTQIIDVPKNTIRWYIKKGREDNFTFAKACGNLLEERNGQFQMTTTQLPNGKTRVTAIHKWNTQADLDAYLSLISTYAAERAAYDTANNIDYTETLTEE